GGRRGGGGGGRWGGGRAGGRRGRGGGRAWRRHRRSGPAPSLAAAGGPRAGWARAITVICLICCRSYVITRGGARFSLSPATFARSRARRGALGLACIQAN